ncbi:MAG: AMP-binding protein [Acidimicrobiaceae bacterium]|nr:AMP-binding protein [Acidimicrobiaceae bacterium]
MHPGLHAATDPDKPAVIMAGSGETISYAQLEAEANQVSRMLRAAGLAPGDHVAWCLENHRNFLPLVWGAHYAGVIYTPISSRLTSDEIAYIVDNSGARAYITSQHKADQSAEVLDRISGVGLRLMMDGAVDGYESYEQALAAASTEPLANRTAGRDMLYSSGTTGRPKGVLVSHEAYDAQEAVSVGEEWSPVAELSVLLLGMSQESVYLTPAPLYHAAPLRFTKAVHEIGATSVVMERFDAEQFLAAIERYGVTHTQVVPTMFVRMLKLPEEQRLRHDLSSLSCVLHAAAPCPVQAKHRMIEWLGPIISEYYAGTEGNGFAFCDSQQWLAHEGTVGAPIACEVHIVDEATGAEVPAGVEGTVYFSSGGTFEYHRDEEKTRNSRLANGWSTLGDVGRVDSDGFLYLTDRKAHMIICGGVNVYPQEAENLLTMHPSVIDAAVIGVPDDDLGEAPKAVVQPVRMPADEAAAADLERRLIDYCRAGLAAVKCPRSVDFRSELPRHDTGKLYKRLLRDEYWQDQDRRI